MTKENKKKSAKTSTKTNEDMTPDEMRLPILKAVMAHVPFDGWSEQAIVAGLGDIGVSRAYAKLSFPEGAADLVDAYLKNIDQEMMQVLNKLPVESMRIRERITKAVRVRMDINAGNREIVARTVTFLALPHNTPLSVKSLWRTADQMWRWAGDRATDYNHYTKRVILSGVYSSTLLYWLNDDSENYSDTWAFLDRRIENVMQFEKLKAKGIKLFDKLPSLADIMRKKDNHKPKD